MAMFPFETRYCLLIKFLSSKFDILFKNIHKKSGFLLSDILGLRQVLRHSRKQNILILNLHNVLTYSTNQGVCTKFNI